MPNGKDDKKSMWRPISQADLQTGGSDVASSGPSMRAPEQRSLYRRVADWATRPTTEFQGTLNRPGFTPLEYGERGLTAASLAAGAPEFGAAAGAVKLGKEALLRTPGALGGAAYGGRLASEVGLPKWSGQAIGGVGGFLAPEVLEKTGGPLVKAIARYFGTAAPEAAESMASKAASAPASTVAAEPSRILTLEQAAQHGGMASAAGGAPAWEAQAISPENQRLLEKIQQGGSTAGENPAAKAMARHWRRHPDVYTPGKQ